MSQQCNQSVKPLAGPPVRAAVVMVFLILMFFFYVPVLASSASPGFASQSDTHSGQPAMLIP